MYKRKNVKIIDVMIKKGSFPLMQLLIGLRYCHTFVTGKQK